VSTLLWARSKLYRRRHSQPVLLSPCCYNDEGVAVVANYCAHRGKIGFILEQLKPSVAGQVAGRRRIPRDPVVRRLQHSAIKDVPAAGDNASPDALPAFAPAPPDVGLRQPYLP